MCFVTIARVNFIMLSPEITLVIIHSITTTMYKRLNYMRKYLAFLHIFNATLYNSINEKKSRFPMILYASSQIHYNLPSISTQNIASFPSYISTSSYNYALKDTSSYKPTSNPAWCPSYTSKSSYNYTYIVIYDPTLHPHHKKITNDNCHNIKTYIGYIAIYKKTSGWYTVPSVAWRKRCPPKIKSLGRISNFPNQKSYTLPDTGHP